MKITIDCRHLYSSGIGVYLRECLPWLLKSKNDFLLLGDSENIRPLINGTDNAEIVDCKTKSFSIAELFFFQKNILKKINRTSLFYSPYFNIPGGIRVPVYTTIHDIIFPDMPELASRLGLAVRMWFYRRAFSRSRKIFTVSEFSKTRIGHYSSGKIPIVVTYSAIQPWILEHGNSGGGKTESIVFIGNIKKHKGLDCLLEAFRLAKAEGLPHRLNIIGSKEHFRSADNAVMRKIESLGNDSVSFTGFVSDGQLAEYVASAALLVQPSLYEGFGLPPLEAMALGTKTLVSDIPVFKEIYDGYPVAFFRAGLALDLKNKMMELLYHKEPERVMLPKELLSKYTFEKTVAVILRELEGGCR